MKKTAITILSAALLLFSGLFTGCQEAIYEVIREDVEPEEATVSGNIGTITRYTANDTEFLLLAADDGLRYKQKDKNSHGKWKTYKLPFSLHSYDFDSSSHSGEQLVSVLADSTTLYIISASYENTSSEGLTYPSNIKLWGKQIDADGSKLLSDGKWTKIADRKNNKDIFPLASTSTGYFTTSFIVFQTNAPMKDHRAAYIRSHNSDTGYHYYKLNGLELPEEITIEKEAIIDPEPSSATDYVPAALGAAYFGGEIKFFTSPVVTTNETYEEEATYYYYTNSDDRLYFSNGTSVNSVKGNSDYVISALATCADSILVGYGKTVGSAGGIERSDLIDGVPVKINGKFSTNERNQITQSYKVLVLLNATPEKKETASSLYAAISFAATAANFEKIGLWSYYPKRGNWNRE